jgi:glycosyltransferase involved in cell wall biosynthesis
MNVVFLSGTASRAAGGVFEVERWLAQKLHLRHGVDVEAAGLLDKNTTSDLPAWHPIQVHGFEHVGPIQFGYSPGLARWLKSSQHDVLHLHNLWMYSSWLTLQWNRSKKRPYVVSLHGMLDPWALKHSGWKKRVAGMLYENRMLQGASVIHAFHDKDLADIRAYGLRNPVAVIPNGVELQEVSLVKPSGLKQRILYLGRLHPKKGVAEMIRAWKLIPNERRVGWKLTIAGWDDGGNAAGLAKLVDELQLGDSIEFPGAVFGDEKQQLFETSAGFILPSFSEGLPMTVLEAWANKLPVIMTEMCNLPQGFAASAAIKIAPQPESIAKGLDDFLKLSDERRSEMGTNGRRLVEREFTWDTVSDQLHSVYQWALGIGPMPECVHLAAHGRAAV